MATQPERKNFTWRSSIHRNLLNATLKRGGLWSGIGAGALILVGTVIPLSLLKIWGIPLFFIGMALIAMGMLPYRKLVKLQLRPDELHFDGKQLTFCKEGKPLFNIRAEHIEKVVFKEKPPLYGIALWLKHPINKRVKVVNPRFNSASFAKKSAEVGCDLWFPYFSERSLTEFTDLLESNHAF